MPQTRAASALRRQKSQDSDFTFLSRLSNLNPPVPFSVPACRGDIAASPRRGTRNTSGLRAPWPSSRRWNPRYDVPGNSTDGDQNAIARDAKPEDDVGTKAASKLREEARSMSYGRNRRDMDTYGTGIGNDSLGVDEAEEFSNLRHWLETLSELYMNELDNRARWDPRWLNVTRRERFEGMESTAVSVVD
ncbi:hypothetical protein QQZ08_006434 [Neonectria magnoliae]|uniref:Uncharacterized protein n=1 Tax=Neonectria magnoliae TaxID=2732573 RepID=A0ABR1I242_9HYPO